MSEERSDRLSAFVEWVGAHITGDEKGQAQVFLDHFFKRWGTRAASMLAERWKNESAEEKNRVAAFLMLTTFGNRTS